VLAVVQDQESLPVAKVADEGREERVASRGLSGRSLPREPQALVIAAIDSTSFEVYSKEAAVADRLAMAFKDVRAENPADYFEPLPGDRPT
jgi:hypothetical protein